MLPLRVGDTVRLSKLSSNANRNQTTLSKTTKHKTTHPRVTKFVCCFVQSLSHGFHFTLLHLPFNIFTFSVFCSPVIATTPRRAFPPQCTSYVKQ